MEEEKKEELEELKQEEKEIEKELNEIKDELNGVPKKKNNTVLIVLIVLAVVILGTIGYVVKLMGDENKNTPKNTTRSIIEKKGVASEYKMSGNGLEKFDLAFLKLENNSKNMVYSPLSIKYALQMIGEGANGNTKAQIDAIIGDYKYKKYNNNSNMSFANALFVRDTYKNKIKAEYKDNLKTKYNAEVVVDSFKDASTINNWVKDKTFNLIDNILGANDINELDFALVNALAIDQEWVNQIQSESKSYDVSFKHEKFWHGVSELSLSGFHELKFDNINSVNSVEISAVANKYDIVKDLGRDNIFNTISKEYKEFLDKGGCEGPDPVKYTEEDVTKYVNNFIDELDTGYKKISSSTDFRFYYDNDYKVFAKDLKKYDGSQLEYIGIMPKNVSLSSYIDSVDKNAILELIGKLKPIELNSFEEGYVTKLTGYIPLFAFDYEIDIKADLKELGVYDVFESDKADLSKMVINKNEYIDFIKHQANIDFSNDGIKAAAVTVGGGKGDAFCGFEHYYEVPVKEIDMTFDKPYLFLIRDKNSGEVWFVGTVYNPTKYGENQKTYGY